MFTQTRAHFTDLAESMHASIERTVPTPQIVIYRHDQGLPAEPSEGGVSWHPIKTQCSIVLIQPSPEAQQSKTTRGNLVQRPTDPCFMGLCFVLLWNGPKTSWWTSGQHHPGSKNLDYLKIRNQTSNRSAHFFRTIWALSHTQCNEAPEATQTLESNFFTHLSFSRPRTRCVHCWRVAILKPTETCSKVNDAIFNFFFY